MIWAKRRHRAAEVVPGSPRGECVFDLLKQLAHEKEVRRVMIVTEPRAWLTMSGTCEALWNSRGNLNNFGLQYHLDVFQGQGSQVSTGIMEVLDFTRVRMTLDEFWGSAYRVSWAHFRATNRRLLSFARQQVSIPPLIRGATSSSAAPVVPREEVLRPDYSFILSASDPRFSADWIPYLDRWETFFEQVDLGTLPEDVAREEAFCNHGIEYDQVLLDAWTFRSLYGRESFVTEVMRRHQLHGSTQSNNQLPEAEDPSSSDSLPSPSSFGSQFDFQVASAANFPVRHGYDFDWEHNLSSEQQAIYHEITGNRLLAMQRNNLSD